MSKRLGFSFSWRRAIGLSSAKGRVSRAIGIPLTESGRRQKTGRLLGSALAAKGRTKPRRGEVAVELDEEDVSAPRGGGIPLIAVVALVGLAACWYVFRT